MKTIQKQLVTQKCEAKNVIRFTFVFYNYEKEKDTRHIFLPLLDVTLTADSVRFISAVTDGSILILAGFPNLETNVTDLVFPPEVSKVLYPRYCQGNFVQHAGTWSALVRLTTTP